MEKMKKVPSDFSCLLKFQIIHLDGQEENSPLLGRLVSLKGPSDVFDRCSVQYTDKNWAFNYSILLTIQRKHGASSGPIHLLHLREGAVENLVVRDTKPQDIEYIIRDLQQQNMPDDIGFIQNSAKNDRLGHYALTIKVRDLIHDYKGLEVLNANDPWKKLFVQKLGHKNYQNSSVKINMLALKGDIKKLQWTCTTALQDFMVVNARWRGDPDGKARRFYKEKNQLYDSHEVHIIPFRQREDGAQQAKFDAKPTIANHVWGSLAVAQADQEAELRAQEFQASKEMMQLSIVTKWPGECTTHWIGAFILPRGFQVDLDSYPSFHVSFYKTQNGQPYPYEPWKASVYRPIRIDLPEKFTFLKLTPPIDNDNSPVYLSPGNGSSNTNADDYLLSRQHPVRNIVSITFEHDSADYKRRQKAAQAMNPNCSNSNKAIAADWQPVWVGGNWAFMNTRCNWFPAGAEKLVSGLDSQRFLDLLREGLGTKSGTIKLTKDQVAAVASLLNAPQKLHIIHGLAGTAKSLIGSIIVSLGARLGHRYALVATEHTIIDNCARDMRKIISTLNKESKSAVFRWYSWESYIAFLIWLCSKGNKDRREELLRLPYDQLTETEKIEIVWANSNDPSYGVFGGKFTLPDYHPVINLLNQKDLAWLPENWSQEKTDKYEADLRHRINIIQGPEILNAIARERIGKQQQGEGGRKEYYTESQVRLLLAETYLRYNGDAEDPYERARRQIATIMLRRTTYLSRKDKNELKDRMGFIFKKKLQDAALVCCTPHRLHELAKIWSWNVTIAEEAESQNIETTMVIVTAQPSAKLLLIGDIHQPGVYHKVDKDGNVPGAQVILKDSILKKLLDKAYPHVLLVTNFRSAATIVRMVSTLFYGSELKAGLPDVLPDSQAFFDFCTSRPYSRRAMDVKACPILIISTPTGVEEGTYGNTESKINLFNRDEVRRISQHLVKHGVPFNDQLIAVPYSGQRKKYGDSDAKVFTVGAIRGRAATVVIFDVVRTKRWGFVITDNKVEEVLTRPRVGMVIIGDFNNLCSGENASIGQKFMKVYNWCKGYNMIYQMQSKQ